MTPPPFSHLAHKNIFTSTSIFVHFCQGTVGEAAFLMIKAKCFIYGYFSSSSLFYLIESVLYRINQILWFVKFSVQWSMLGFLNLFICISLYIFSFLPSFPPFFFPSSSPSLPASFPPSPLSVLPSFFPSFLIIYLSNLYI